MAGRNVTMVTEFILLGLTNDPMLQIILFIIFLFVYMVIILGNLLIVLVTITDTSLQYPMYFFLVNLSLLDTCYSSSIIPRMLRDLLSAQKNISTAECAAQLYISLVMGEAECILLAIMAYDRYVAICYPLHYTTIIRRSVCIKLASGTWICAFVMVIPTAIFTFNMDFCGHNEINHFECENPGLLALACGDTTNLELVNYIVASAMLIPTVIFILSSYVKIIRTILKLASAQARRKTFSTCGSHIMVVTLFYGSGMITYLRPRTALGQSKMSAVFYTIIAPMLNPLIYTLRNKEVKNAVRKIVRKMMYQKM